MKIILILSLFTILPFSQAQAAEVFVCPDPKQLAAEIMNCDQNAKAALYAANCSAELSSKMSGTRVQLARAMVSLQNATFGSEGGRVARAERLLRDMSLHIDLTQSNTEVLSHYTDAMIDFPEGVDEASSAPCFNEAFSELQGAVKNLDNDILRSEDSYAEARQAFAAWKEKRSDAKQLLAAAAEKLRAVDRDTRMLSSQKKKKLKK